MEIRVYTINDEGKLESDSISPIESFGEVPQVGDTLHEGLRGSGIGFYRVEHRYFFQSQPGPGWAIVVRKRRPTELDKAVLSAWLDDNEFWGEIDRQESAEREKELLRQLGIASDENPARTPKRPHSQSQKKSPGRKK
jgi:hypothetical protein